MFGGERVPGYYVSNMANERLKWETTEQWNAGLDLGFFEDRIKVTADWYDKVTRDLLLYALLPASSGFGAGDAQHRQDPQPRLRADARNGERQDPSVPVVHVVQHRLQPQPDSRAGRRTEHAPEFRIVGDALQLAVPPTSRR